MFSEKKILLYGTLLFFLIGLATGELFLVPNESWKKAVSVVLNLIILYGIWFTGARVVQEQHLMYPGSKNIQRRVLRSLLFIAVIIIVTSVGSYFFLVEVISMNSFMSKVPHWYVIQLTVINSLFLAAGITAVLEANHSFGALRQSEKEKDELQKANLQSRFDSLKGQVNPHFLFNSLNSLSSLISKDPVRAEAFVEELSSVYRYLLRSNEQERITLKEEIAFIHSYIHLLSTRFGENFRVQIDVYQGYHLYQIPPLTLQMLVENAVKHNIISKEEPLTLKIFTTADHKLHVENNLQRKTREVGSNKVGLANIMDRYKLLKQPDVEVRDTGAAFIVIVPLIKPEIHESTDN